MTTYDEMRAAIERKMEELRDSHPTFPARALRDLAADELDKEKESIS